MKREHQLTDTVLHYLTPILEELCKSSKLTEILWNFARYKDERRLALSQNPHFYKDLPRNKHAYREDFQRDPTENFLGSTGIYVLIDRPGRVYLESDQNSRAFGNVWAPSKAMIFKGSCITFSKICTFSNIFPDVCGKLEGESHVQKSIQTASNLWYLDVPPLSPTSLPVSPNQNSPSPTMTASSVGSASDASFADWREPIRRGLNSPDTHICIRAVPPSTSSSIATSPSSPTSSAVSSGSISSPLQIGTQSIARPTHGSARPKAGSQLSPTSGLLPRTLAPSPSTALPEPFSPQRPPIAASPLTDKPTTVTTTPIMPTSRDEPQKLEDSTGKVPMSLPTPDIKDSTPRPSGTFAPPQAVSSLPKLHTAGVEVTVRYSTISHVDRGSKPTPPQAFDVPQHFSFSQLKQLWTQKCSQVFGK